MNMQEYNKRVEKQSLINGDSSYYDELQKMIKERDKWKMIAQMQYDAIRMSIAEPVRPHYMVTALRTYEKALCNE